MNAPVALFVYDRADNVRRTLDCLLANTLARDTELYVFSDGGRDAASWRRVNAVRRLLAEVSGRVERTGALARMTVVERPENVYLEENIMRGVAHVLERHDRIVVLEDDICTSPHFLQFMNDALRLYADTPRVMHVSGFTNLDLWPDGGTPFYFTPHMSGWGWGTWRDRWQQHFKHYSSRSEALDGFSAEQLRAVEYGGAFPCLKSLDRNPVPWDICWELAIHRAGGLCLTPGHTLVRNIGLGSGTHFRSFRALQRYEFDRPPLSEALPLTKVDDPQPDPRCERLFAEAITDWGIRYTWLGKRVRNVYKMLKKSN